jgi:peptide/nickel transport system substrate-binding protein
MSRPSTTWEHIDFFLGYYPFQEKAMREAILLGINRHRIVDKVFGRTGVVLNGVVPTEVYYSIENPNLARNYPDIAARYKLPNYDYNPARANQLLDQAGWVRRADGIRTKGGLKLSFEYGAPTQAVRQQIQALVSTDLKAIGVDAVAKNYPAGLFFDNSPESPRVNATIKLAQFSWVTTRDSDFSTWVCPVDSYASQRPPDSTWSCLASADFERANAAFNAEIDPVAQLSAAAEAQFLLMRDIVTIPLFQYPRVELVRNNLANYKLPNSALSSFWNARQWYFK